MLLLLLPKIRAGLIYIRYARYATSAVGVKRWGMNLTLGFDFHCNPKLPPRRDERAPEMSRTPPIIPAPPRAVGRDRQCPDVLKAERARARAVAPRGPGGKG